MPLGRLPREVFQACPTGRRPRGRPRTRWRDYVSRVAWERLGVPPEELDPEVSGSSTFCDDPRLYSWRKNDDSLRRPQSVLQKMMTVMQQVIKVHKDAQREEAEEERTQHTALQDTSVGGQQVFLETETVQNRWTGKN
ncbi:hypothetical protein L3Q82_010460 [Scortum barcoo]|uniref:Uncharacterized protein n=1 Tax=Scortum barcoo TaxID=214431 RepID=A0ACB8WC34_9TELE|nr:hypothetical protein L3Q82_010460 [Scortum barcoo]